ncbi:hypothetical protein PtB15_14B302 [Puccinia triticina]|nr:hypothetical protein PtB15_14B302 [Puccinia triticina]
MTSIPIDPPAKSDGARWHTLYLVEGPKREALDAAYRNQFEAPGEELKCQAP